MLFFVCLYINIISCYNDMHVIITRSLARLHFSAEELLLLLYAPASASASASACKMLGQMLKSWNLGLSVFFLAF